MRQSNGKTDAVTAQPLQNPDALSSQTSAPDSRSTVSRTPPRRMPAHRRTPYRQPPSVGRDAEAGCYDAPPVPTRRPTASERGMRPSHGWAAVPYGFGGTPIARLGHPAEPTSLGQQPNGLGILLARPPSSQGQVLLAYRPRASTRYNSERQVERCSRAKDGRRPILTATRAAAIPC